MQLTFAGGFYQSRGVIANAQRCVNLYAEKNPPQSPAPLTLYPTPGIGIVTNPNVDFGPKAGVARGGYFATNGAFYTVVGQTLYYVDPTFRFFTIGQLTAVLTTPVGMVDNGNALIVVDGSLNGGYVVDLTTNAFGPIATGTGFVGATCVDYLDTFVLFNQPGTRNFYTTLSNSTYADFISGDAFDPTYIAAKTGFPDNINALIVMHREIWLCGSMKTSEIWYDAGGTAFPFQIIPGIFLEHGVLAPYSLKKYDLAVFFLGIDAAGIATVYMGQGYRIVPVSTFAIAQEFSKYSNLSSAIGMVYKQQDHAFYILTFPDDNKTWVYDIIEDIWHERTWTDTNGTENRIRWNWVSQAYGKIVAGDWENGTLYEVRLDRFDDAGAPIVRRRGFDHLINDGKRVTYDSFIADVECGDADLAIAYGDTQIFLRWSDDRGKTFGTPVGQSLGLTGQFLAQPKWNQLGLARDRVFELFWSAPVETSCDGAFIQMTPAGT